MLHSVSHLASSGQSTTGTKGMDLCRALIFPWTIFHKPRLWNSPSVSPEAASHAQLFQGWMLPLSMHTPRRGSHGVVLQRERERERQRQREREREREIRDETRLSILESWRPPVMWRKAAMEEEVNRLGTTGQAKGSFLGNGYPLPCNSEDSWCVFIKNACVCLCVCVC